jgi:hypothetical protein
MAGFSLYVSDCDVDFQSGHLCYHHNTSTLPELVQEIRCKVHGRYLTFYNERLPDVTYPNGYSPSAMIQLCEINVYGTVSFVNSRIIVVDIVTIYKVCVNSKILCSKVVHV